VCKPRWHVDNHEVAIDMDVDRLRSVSEVSPGLIFRHKFPHLILLSCSSSIIHIVLRYCAVLYFAGLYCFPDLVTPCRSAFASKMELYQHSTTVLS